MTAVEAAAPTDFTLRRSWFLVLAGFFLLSLGLRLPGIFTLGMDLAGPGTFQAVNYDEGNSCEAALGWMAYPTFVGVQVLEIARVLGVPPPAQLEMTRAKVLALADSDPRQFARGTLGAEAYCQNRALTVIQRAYSAVTGALTVALLGLLALMMWPHRPQIAWTACALLAFSNFHVAESHFATLEAPQLFFVLLLTVALAYAVVSRARWPIIISPLLLAAAVLTKWYLFAIFAYACLASRVRPTIRTSRTARFLLLALCFLTLSAALVGLLVWVHSESAAEILQARFYLLWGSESGTFGTDYGHIGTWRRWIRNVTNVPIVMVMALGLPACLFAWRGLRRALETREAGTLWLAQAPALVYALYMVAIGPVSYYRHYLPLLVPVILLAAYGFWESRWAASRLALAGFVLYPLLLTVDSEYDYRHDPRVALRQWYQEHDRPKILFTYYVVPPPAPRGTAGVFDVAAYVRGGAPYLRNADYVILSENWYDTAFPNELNGPIAWKPEWLIKTRPEDVLAYRMILAGEDPNLLLESELGLTHFMPEPFIHRYFYGSFQQFVGDLKIFRVRH
jgi:hypothetical protein